MIGDLQIANDAPFTVFGGLNVLEKRDLTLAVAEHFAETCLRLKINWVFKASFDKANRSSLASWRGPGLEEGLKQLDEVNRLFGVPVMTDIHLPHQAAAVAEVAQILQIPAFLCRQTDLLIAAADTGLAINIKKAQFLAAEDMVHVLQKCRSSNNWKLILCERGSAFGYHNLIVDMLGLDLMKRMSVPVIFDVTHALQLPGAGGDRALGRRQQIVPLARSALIQGLAGLFIETHPDPERALCDGPCALQLDRLHPLLSQLKAVDELAKSLPPSL